MPWSQHSQDVSTSVMRVRPADLKDLPAVAELVRFAAERPYSDAAISRQLAGLDSSRYLVWVAEDQTGVCGITMVERRRVEYAGTLLEAGYWMNLYVRGDRRGSMAYARLLNAMFKGASAAGLDLIYGAIRRRDVASGHLSAGMRYIGEIPVLARPLRPARLFALKHDAGRVSRMWAGLLDTAFNPIHRITTRNARVRQTVLSTTADVDFSRFTQVVSMPTLFRQPWTAGELTRRFQWNLDGQEYWAVRSSGGDADAVVVCRFAERWNGMRALVIMEILPRVPDVAAVARCLARATRLAIEKRVDVILALGDPGQRAVLRRNLFFPSGESYALLWRPTSPATTSLETPPLDECRFAFADHDAF